jgi:hypothetical protein
MRPDLDVSPRRNVILPGMREGEAPDSRVWSARLDLHTGLHVAVRAWNAVSPLGLAQTARLRGLLAASAARDLAEAVWIARDPRPHPLSRLVLECVDSAAWAAIEPQETRSYTAALLPGVALALEGGYRRSWWWSATVPVATSVAAGAARRAVRKSVEPSEIVWQALGSLGGQALRWYERRTVEDALREQRRMFEPEILAAELDAEAALLLRDTVADDLQGIVHRASLLHRPTGDPLEEYRVAQRLKSRHAKNVRQSAASYAVTAMRLLETSRNAVTPSVREWLDVSFETERDRLRVLSPTEAQWLTDTVLQVAPRGSVVIGFEDPHRRQGRRGIRRPDLIVRINGQDHASPSRTLQFGLLPVGWFGSALMGLTASLKNQVEIPLPVTGAVAALGFAAAGIAARDPSDRGADRSTRVAAAMPLLMGTVGTALMRQHHRDGVSRFNATSISAFLMAALYTWPRLRRSTRTTVVASAAASVAASWFLAKEPRSGRSFLSEVIWPAAAISVAHRTQKAVGREAERQAELLAAELRAAQVTAATQAVRTMVDELHEHYRRCRMTLERARAEVGETSRETATAREAMAAGSNTIALIARLARELDDIAPRLARLRQDIGA